VTLGIRPQHLTLGEGGIIARAEVVEPTGKAQESRARLGGVDLRAVLRDAAPVRPGDLLPLRYDPARALVFDAAGARLR
jgi:multiple sugar transport system ATP-binding protein